MLGFRLPVTQVLELGRLATDCVPAIHHGLVARDVNIRGETSKHSQLNRITTTTKGGVGMETGHSQVVEAAAVRAILVPRPGVLKEEATGRPRVAAVLALARRVRNAGLDRGLRNAESLFCKRERWLVDR